MMVKSKEIILSLPNDKKKAAKIVKTALENKINSFYCNPTLIDNKIRSQVRIFSNVNEGDILVIDSLEQIKESNESDKRFVFLVKLAKKDDEEKVINASQKGAMGVFIETVDWKIIPLENLVAKLRKNDTRIYAKIKTIDELQTMFNILESGLDGVIYSPKNPYEVKSLSGKILKTQKLELTPIRIVEKKELGVGDRACIDTASLLEVGDGALIGNQSNLLFLIHSETIGSDFSAPRPFRINAGAIHSYIVLPDGKTKYLSEIESGNEVLIVNRYGITKSAIVGRSKIEKRPLLLIIGKKDNQKAGILVQNAETIRLVKKNGDLISVTHIKPGDEVLVYIHSPTGRHFGIEVDEHIVEK
jgi:3-dehydroquinate synthase II